MENKYLGNKTYKTINKKIVCFMTGVLMAGFLFSSQKSYATHAAGADLTYRWISNSGNQSTYEITGTFYRDCAGVAAPNNLTIVASSVSCGFTGNNSRQAIINPIGGTGQEISFPCSSAVTTCTSSGSPNPGFQKYVYRGTIVLPQRCSDWVFSYSVCCRNCAITTMTQNSPCNSNTVTTNIYVESTLNNLAVTANNSPTFNNVPVAFLCLGQSFTYNHGVTDADGDSLYYDLVNARTNATTSIPYINPFSGVNPLSSAPAVSINHNTGDITMNPTALEVGVVAIRIREYRNGVLIGSVIRDMQFVVKSCGSNNLPTASGINGTAKYSAIVCAGSSISFNINTNDANVGQIVSITWDGGIPGATFTSAGSPHPTATFTWNTTLANARSQPYQFTVTVRDDNCPTNGFQSYAFSISVPLISVTLVPSLHNGFNVSCNGGSNGSILASPSGGTPPYTYSWSNGATTQTASGLTAGAFTVTVTDSAGCTNTATASITLTQPPVLTASVTSHVNVSCFGNNTGTATATPVGGVPGYTYSWNSAPVQTTRTATGLTSGTYTVTVTDTNGCTTNANVTITQPTFALASVVTTSNNVTCNGNSNGTINLTVTGGTPSYSYLWSNGATTQDLAALDTGTYSVVVTDSLGCTSSTSATISQPGALVPLITSVSVGGVNISCAGGSTGSATASATGGTLPYHYLWTPSGDTTASETGLSAGPISVLVTDANGCTGSAYDTLTQPDSLLSSVVSVSLYPGGFNITCKGLTNGSVDLGVTGGTAPYTYAWSNAATTQDLSGIGAGTYNVTVTDTNGCATTNSVTLTEPDTLDPVVASPTSAGGYNIGCHGESSGAINTLVTGGTTPYTYLWSNAATTANLIHLSVGTYFLTVTDLNGCTDTASVYLSQPDTILPLITSVTFNGGVNITCAGNSNGSDSVSVTGGTPAYSYFWSTSDTTQTVSGLSAGPISVHIVDANGCSADGYDTLLAPLPLNADSIVVSTYPGGNNVSCNGSTNGTINVYLSGGTQPYSYLWSTGNPADTLSSLTGLGAGSYSVNVTDANGCTATFGVTLTEPDTLAPNAVVTSFNGFEIRCNGGNSGAIDLTTSGGAAPYTFLWSNGPTTEDNNGLIAGSYNVTITDTNGCSQNFAYILTQPTPISILDTLSQFIGGHNISCNGFSDGAIRLFPSGGVPSYTYTWAYGGSTTDSAFSLSAGTYAYTVTDTNGCSVTDSITLTQPTSISIVPTVTLFNGYNISCYGGSNGCISVVASGGTPGYTYQWSNEQATDTICNLSAGEYASTVTDTNGCIGTLLVDLFQPDSIAIVPVLSQYTGGFNISCFGQSNGSINLTDTGGVLPYSYVWNPNTDTTQNVSGLTAGTYTVHIIDGNGCSSDSISITLNEPPAFTDTLTSTPTACGLNIGTVTVTVSGAVPPYTYAWNTPNLDITSTVDSLPSAIYSVVVTDSLGCTVSGSILVGNAANLSATDSTTDNICNGGHIGTATVYPSGGTAPYTYLWSTSPGDTTASVDSLGAGTYSCIVTDSNSCSYTIFITINQPAPLVFTPGPAQSVCGNSTTMAATLPAGYTGIWTVLSGSGTFGVGQNTNPNAQVDALSYTTNVFQWTITNGTCSDSNTVAITAYAPIVAIAGPPQSVCRDSAALDANGISGYVGTWTVLSGSATFSNIHDTASTVNNMTPGANVFQWTLTNGTCSDSSTVTIDYAPFFANAGGNHNVCGDSTTLFATAIAGFHGTWTLISGSGTIVPPDTNATIVVTGLGVGPNVFQWYITNGSCFDSSRATITAFAPVTVTGGSGQTVCPDTANLTATTVAGYTGAWTVVSGSGNFNPSANPLTQVTGMTSGTNIFQWTIGNGVCSANTRDTVNYDPAIANPGPNQTICVTNTTMQATLAPGYAGTWTHVSGGGAPVITNITNPVTTISNLPIGISIFRWSITNGTCHDSAIVSIDVSAAVTANAGPDQDACLNTATLAATLISGYIGTWSTVSGGANFSNLHDTAATITNLLVGNNIFQWTITNGVCTASDNVTVTNFPANAGSNDSTCGNSYVMTATLNPGYTGVWTILSGTGTFTPNTTTATATVSGLTLGNNTFMWTVTNGICRDSARVTILSSSPVTADAGSDTTICKVLSDKYTLDGSRPVVGSGVWTIYSGVGATIDNPNSSNAILHPALGINILVWTVMNGACVNSDSVDVTYKDDGSCFSELELPTAFSPNGDLFNPAYVIHGIEKYPVNSFKVFNRWGNLVYSKDNYQNQSDNLADWIGQNNSGDPLPEGTYFVILEIKNSNLSPSTRNTYVDLRR